MVKIGVHLRKLSQNKIGVPLFGPPCTSKIEAMHELARQPSRLAFPSHYMITSLYGHVTCPYRDLRIGRLRSNRIRIESQIE